LHPHLKIQGISFQFLFAFLVAHLLTAF
jgi:hypothetical protein